MTVGDAGFHPGWWEGLRNRIESHQRAEKQQKEVEEVEEEEEGTFSRWDGGDTAEGFCFVLVQTLRKITLRI